VSAVAAATYALQVLGQGGRGQNVRIRMHQVAISTDLLPGGCACSSVMSVPEQPDTTAAFPD